MKQAHSNVTFNLPDPLLRKFRVYAAEHNRSMNSIITDAINQIVDQKDDERERIKRRFLERLKNPSGRSATGKITWTRDELYERVKDLY